MKMSKLVILIVMIALALFLALPNLSWAADDGASLYKAKCAMCHGADRAGNRLLRFRAWFPTMPRKPPMPI
jgi:mono/diheme cytochrome c family protein